MKIQVCHACRRVNPAAARYCHHDGVALGGGTSTGPLDAGSALFLSPLVFPSGRSCRNFDELVLAAEELWDEAKELLRDGHLAGFFGGVGRGDLARLAGQAKNTDDPSRALDDFLQRLPSSARQPPKLHVQPREFNLGVVRRSETRRLLVVIRNEGMGMLHGTIAALETPWLMLGDPPGVPAMMFECRQETILPVLVIGDKMRAGSKPQEGALVVEANGGKVSIPVKAERPATPFFDGVLAGAKSPRQLAEKARATPKDAVPFFESGAVRAWYEANGWTWPIQGPQAAGLGAVQQFFEALGLTSPPRVEISDRFIKFIGRPGETHYHTLRATTTENRPVYVFARSELPWLKIGKIAGTAKNVRINVEVTIPDQPGEALLGRFEVTANGNQRFVVAVSLAIMGQRPAPVTPEPFEVLEPSSIIVLPDVPPAPPPPVPEPVAEPNQIIILDDEPEEEIPSPAPAPAAPIVSVPAPFHQEAQDLMTLDDPELGGAMRAAQTNGSAQPRPSSRHGSGFSWRHLVGPVAILALLITTLIHDAMLPARPQPGPPGPPEPPPRKRLPLTDPEPFVAIRWNDGPQRIRPDVLPHGTMRFGVILPREKDPADPTRPQRLTFDEWGRSNNTCLRIDGKEVLFGEAGEWMVLRRERGQDPDHKRPINGAETIWRFGSLDVTQLVEVMVGRQTGRLDTCLVRYTLVNRSKDEKPLQVGLRILLDTFIGTMDGAPFTLPGLPELCATNQSFQTRDAVPDFIEAVERATLNAPGTVLRLDLRLGKKLESPSRVLVGGYPNKSLAGEVAQAANEKTLWNVPILSIRELYQRMQDRVKAGLATKEEADRVKPDSAVTLYWEVKPLGPGEKREVGFALGLGKPITDPGGKLLASLGGRFVPGGEFTVAMLVNDPKKETLTLTFPEGIQMLPGVAPTQEAPAVAEKAERKASVVSWRLKATKAGTFKLRVEASTGATLDVPVQIHEPLTESDIFD